jgi:mRNA interferase HigB
MRIIAVATLRAFWDQPSQPAAELPMRAWTTIVKGTRWQSPVEVKATFNSADLLANGRVVFDIGGNKWRIVAKLNFRHQIMYVRFVGTHGQYDKIDANEV